MLWKAGQERLAREALARKRESFTVARDAIIAADVAVGRATARGDVTPAYARPDAPVVSAESQALTLARLAARFPGAVSRRLS